MAGSIRTVKGKAISGPEEINPARLTFPNDILPHKVDYKPYEVDIPFTYIQKDVVLAVKRRMQSDGRLTGSRKIYDKIDRKKKTATFSWWSVYLDETALSIVNQKRNEKNWIINEYFEGTSMYGGNRLILPLNKLMEVYRDKSGKVPVVRILGTFQYRNEWMHAFVITPSDDKTFQNHPEAARFNKTLEWYSNLPVIANNGEYKWKAFSIATWDQDSPPDKKRKWNHVAFAFHLDPLPNKVLQLQSEDVMDCNWQTVKTTDYLLYS